MLLKFYTFKTDESKSVDVNVDEFQTIVAELHSLHVSVFKEV